MRRKSVKLVDMVDAWLTFFLKNSPTLYVCNYVNYVNHVLQH